MIMNSYKIGFKIVILMISLMLFSGCTPEKAKSIRLAAEQFSNQALIAINAVEKVMKDELAPQSRSAQEQADQFVDFLSNLDLDMLRENDIELNFPTMEQAASPDSIELDPIVVKSRNNYLNELRIRYTTFAGMLQGLETGSFFAADAVERANKLANRLTVDMASIAKHFSIHPPIL